MPFGPRGLRRSFLGDVAERRSDFSRWREANFVIGSRDVSFAIGEPAPGSALAWPLTCIKTWRCSPPLPRSCWRGSIWHCGGVGIRRLDWPGAWRLLLAKCAQDVLFGVPVFRIGALLGFRNLTFFPGCLRVPHAGFEPKSAVSRRSVKNRITCG
jgi:hypothetical protein